MIRMLKNVQQTTIAPLIKATIALGAQLYTDEYAIYKLLLEWGYAHKTVYHGVGEYARDDNGDGFCAVHVNTMEGLWSLFCSWLRPHRGLSQEKLPLYLGFFESVHNAAVCQEFFNEIGIQQDYCKVLKTIHLRRFCDVARIIICCFRVCICQS